IDQPPRMPLLDDVLQSIDTGSQDRTVEVVCQRSDGARRLGPVRKHYQVGACEETRHRRFIHILQVELDVGRARRLYARPQFLRFAPGLANDREVDVGVRETSECVDQAVEALVRSYESEEQQLEAAPPLRRGDRGREAIKGGQ